MKLIAFLKNKDKIDKSGILQVYEYKILKVSILIWILSRVFIIGGIFLNFCSWQAGGILDGLSFIFMFTGIAIDLTARLFLNCLKLDEKEEK